MLFFPIIFNGTLDSVQLVNNYLVSKHVKISVSCGGTQRSLVFTGGWPIIHTQTDNSQPNI